MGTNYYFGKTERTGDVVTRDELLASLPDNVIAYIESQFSGEEPWAKRAERYTLAIIKNLPDDFLYSELESFNDENYGEVLVAVNISESPTFPDAIYLYFVSTDSEYTLTPLT